MHKKPTTTIEPLFKREQSASRQIEALRRKNAALRILVADDSQTMRIVIRGLLREMGCVNIDDAADGDIALQKIRSNKYDLVVLDNQMPKMHGISLLEKVRASEETKDIAIVMVTAELSRDLAIKAAQIGINDFIVKPFSAASFTQRMSAVLANLKKRKVVADPSATWSAIEGVGSPSSSEPEVTPESPPEAVAEAVAESKGGTGEEKESAAA